MASAAADGERTALGQSRGPDQARSLLPWNWAATKAVEAAATGTPTV